jgi:hypothetical protein
MGLKIKHRPKVKVEILNNFIWNNQKHNLDSGDFEFIKLFDAIGNDARVVTNLKTIEHLEGLGYVERYFIDVDKLRFRILENIPLGNRFTFTDETNTEALELETAHILDAGERFTDLGNGKFRHTEKPFDNGTVIKVIVKLEEYAEHDPQV